MALLPHPSLASLIHLLHARGKASLPHGRNPMFGMDRFLSLNITGILVALLGSAGKRGAPRRQCRDHVALKHNG